MKWLRVKRFLYITTISVMTALSGASAQSEKAVVFPPGLEPGGVPVGGSALIRVSGVVSGLAQPPANLFLEELDEEGNPQKILGRLADNGKDGDHVLGDCVYTGWLKVEGKKTARRRFRLRTKAKGVDLVSDSSILWVTNFPLESSAAQNEVITDPITGDEFLANELLVSFHDNVTDDRIMEIVEVEQGVVIKVIPGLFFFQIGGQGKGTASALKQWAKSFLRHSEVATAEPGMITHFGGSSPPNKSLTPTNPAQGDR